MNGPFFSMCFLSHILLYKSSSILHATYVSHRLKYYSPVLLVYQHTYNIHARGFTLYVVVSQDNQGNTALHRAVFGSQLQSVIPLLNAGADPKIPNHALNNSMHRASTVGFVCIVGVKQTLCIHYYTLTLS